MLSLRRGHSISDIQSAATRDDINSVNPWEKSGLVSCTAVATVLTRAWASRGGPGGVSVVL